MLFNFRIPAHRVAAAVLVASLSGYTVAHAAEAPPDAAEAPQHERGLPPHLAALNLSDAQKDKIRSLHQAGHQQHEQQRDDGRALHEKLHALNPGAANYTQEVDRIATQMGQEQAQRIREMAAMRAQVWAILTPQQQVQLAAMPAEERGAHRHGHGRKHN